MTLQVSFDELENAFYYVSGAQDEYCVWISLETGHLHWESDDQIEELPDDILDADKYLAIPSKYDLDLGNRLALKFGYTHLPNKADYIEEIFRKRGAYRRFKDFLHEEGQLEAWYAFELDAIRNALTEWCEQYSIDLIFDTP